MQQCIQPTGTNRPRAWRPTRSCSLWNAQGLRKRSLRRGPARRNHGWSCPAECKISGGHGGGETPVPIPNTAVKPARADGTWGEAPWESRSPPGFLTKPPLSFGSRGFRTFWARRRGAVRCGVRRRMATSTPVRALRYCRPCGPHHDQAPAPGTADAPAGHRRGAPGVDPARAALRPVLRGGRLPGGRPAQRRPSGPATSTPPSSAISPSSSPSGGPGSTSPGSPRPTTSTTCSTACSPSCRSSGS